MTASSIVGFVFFLTKTFLSIGLSIYVLSSGPLLGLAFWLRETTGEDGFYVVMYFYAPIFWLMYQSDGKPIAAYITWWVVDVFHTLGPG